MFSNYDLLNFLPNFVGIPKNKVLEFPSTFNLTQQYIHPAQLLRLMSANCMEAEQEVTYEFQQSGWSGS